MNKVTLVTHSKRVASLMNPAVHFQPGFVAPAPSPAPRWVGMLMGAEAEGVAGP